MIAIENCLNQNIWLKIFSQLWKSKDRKPLSTHCLTFTVSYICDISIGQTSNCISS